MQNKKKDEMIDLRSVALRYLREWKWFVFSVFCCLGLAFFYLKITSPVYQINANVLVKEQENSSSKSLSALKNFNFAMGGAVEVEDELQIISSFS
ncbi:MAG: Wzz/FepE/Etk N-terminal domain-containing protein, partial [Bacteroidales bacterium]